MHPEPHDVHVEVPDFIPDELLEEFAGDLRGAAVPASTSPIATDRAPLRAVLPPSQAHDRVQRIHALLGLVIGYVGLVACTAWWWSLATTTGEVTWWWFAGAGVVGTAAATLTLLGYVAKRVGPATGTGPSTPAPTAGAPRPPAA